MASIAAAEVAREVIRTVGKGRKPHLTNIAISKGYSPESARVGKPIQTKTYQAEIKPLVSRLEEERDAIMERLKTTRNKAKYRDLIDGMDKVTKNIQLLTGGATQNIAVGVKKLKDDELADIVSRG